MRPLLLHAHKRTGVDRCPRPSGRRVVLCHKALLCVALQRAGALQRAFTGRSFFRAADLLPHDRLDRIELRVERILIASVRR